MVRTATRTIDLNSASEKELSRIPGVGRQRAHYLAQHRPFSSINDIKRIPGFTDKMVEDLRRAGAMVGRGQPVAGSYSPRAPVRRTGPAAKAAPANRAGASRRTTHGRNAYLPDRSSMRPIRSRASVRIYRNAGYGSERVPTGQGKHATEVDTDRLVTELNNLIRLDIDAIRAYQEAIDSGESAVVRKNLEAFKGDHERHVTELSAVVGQLGGTPPTSRDQTGSLIQEFASARGVTGTGAVLSAMRANEMVTNRTYELASRDVLYPAEIRTIVERNHRDEKHHLAWIEKHMQMAS